MEKLNSDAKMQILMKLSGDEIVKVCQTSKDLYRACNDERYTPLWRQKIKDEFNIKYNCERGYDKYRDLRTIFGTTVFVAIYVLSDDSDEPQVKVFATKESAIRYVENEIRNYEGQEDFQIDETEEDMTWDLDYGVHWEITEQKIN